MSSPPSYIGDFIEACADASVPTVLVSKNPNNINKVRLENIDYQISLEVPPDPPDIESLNLLSFISCKNILSKGKIYPSYGHLKKGVDISFMNDIITQKEDKEAYEKFWSDLSYFKILKRHLK